VPTQAVRVGGCARDQATHTRGRSPRDIKALGPMTDGYDPIVVAGPTSRFLEKALNWRAPDSVSPRMGKLARRCRTNVKGRQSRLAVSSDFMQAMLWEVRMHIGSALLAIWLVIGVIAAGQRGDYKGPIGCSGASTIAVTIIAGPLNYAGVNPNVSCTVQHPSKLVTVMDPGGRCRSSSARLPARYRQHQ